MCVRVCTHQNQYLEIRTASVTLPACKRENERFVSQHLTFPSSLHSYYEMTFLIWFQGIETTGGRQQYFLTVLISSFKDFSPFLVK